MSILIEYENGNLKTAALVSKRTTPSPSYLCEDGKTFCIGDIFDVTFEELSKMDWQTDPMLLDSVLGTKAIVRADKSSCSFAVDLSGLDTFYYYHKERRFIISDNFWDIVRQLEPSYGDLDISQLRRQLIIHSVEGKTFIKDLYILKPCQIGLYDPSQDTLSIRKYRHIQYRYKITDIADAADRVDALMHDFIEKIQKKCGDVTFGLGLSGGMDSRLIPHYAKAHNLKLTTFNTCIPYPHKFFLAQSVARAKELAKIFDIPFYPVPWKDDDLKEKIRLATKNFPLDIGGSASKYESAGLPAYDVLITGTGGPVVGSDLPHNLSQRSEEELLDFMTRFFFPTFTTSFSNRARRAICYFLGKPPKVNDPNPGALRAQLLTKEDYAVARNELSEFIAEGKKIGLGNVDIFEDYYITVVTSMVRNGAHESGIGTKRAFLFYMTFILQESLNWDPKFLEDRDILKELIRRHLPEVANIKGETFSVAPANQSPSLFSKIWSLLEFLLRGNGAAIDEYAFHRRHIRKCFIDEMNQNRDSWFHKAMGICDTEITDHMVRNDSARTAIRIWQLKDIIDCIEHKEYLSF